MIYNKRYIKGVRDLAPKQKITKEQLLEAAFEITRREGFSAVTARSVAEAAGCSIQPVFSQFATMEALHQAVFSYACRRFTNEIMKNKDRPDFIACTNKWVLNLARREPNLFHLLYLSDSFQGQNLWEVMMGYETNREMAAVFQERYGLTEEECKDIFLRGYLLLHGIAAMIATNHMDFSDEQAADMVKRTVADMVEGARRRQSLGDGGEK